MEAKQEKLDIAGEEHGTLREALPSPAPNSTKSHHNLIKLPAKKEKTRFTARHKKKIQISVTIAPDLLEKFEKRVAQIGQTRAAVLSFLIAKWLKV